MIYIVTNIVFAQLDKKIVIINPLKKMETLGSVVVSDILINNGSSNGLAPARHQAIAWINADILIIEPKKLKNTHIFCQANTFKDIVYKMAAIMFRPHCVASCCLNHL